MFTDYIYDIETYPNFFSCTLLRVDTGELWMYEVSDRANHADALRSHIQALSHDPAARMFGYNNLHFDYPVLHYALQGDNQDIHLLAYEKAQQIIGADWDDRFAHVIWDRDHIVPQVDLFKIHHFDNVARATSLKVLECNMKSENVADLPFPPGTSLTYDEMGVVLEYNKHDVMETWRFYLHSKDKIRFREELTERYGKSFMNHNDTKIGKDYFVTELNKAGIQTHVDRKPLQTRRDKIHLGDAVLEWIEFKEPEFQRIADWFRSQTITQTKGVFDGINATVNGFTFDFGLGGIHGSVESRKVYSDDHYRIIDLDVTSYYPNLAIANRFYPAHLGPEFCDIYRQVFEQRKSYPKGSSENAALKLALNGVYGDSNNQYSPFYDPLYTMKITINGQLLLCLLAEALMREVEGLEMIQINTDGLTVRVPRQIEPHVKSICKDWEKLTGLELEAAEYSRMFIRDVNNYLAEYTDGKVKRKGAYAYGSDLDWNQNHGEQVIAKAVEAHLIHGESIRRFIETHLDLHDFMANTKVPRNSSLVLVDFDGNEQKLHNVTRYYVSKDGGSLVKLMPPLARAKTQDLRRIGIKVGHKVWPANRLSDGTAPINYEYYINEAQKLSLS